MKIFLKLISLMFICGVAIRADNVKVRPIDWAQPVIGAKSLSNLYHVTDELYRSEQPAESDLPDVRKLGIKTLISLRHYHSDSKKYEEAGIGTLQFKMDAGSVSFKDLVQVLRAIRSSPKPVLLHCWCGSDRTGFIVAGYRIVEQNWTKEKAIEELTLGGYGYHASTYANIVELLGQMNVDDIRREVSSPRCIGDVPAAAGNGGR